MSQISIFDGAEPLRIRKPIMLVELFAGYGSQALALKYLGVPFQRLMISEWAIPSILAYKDLHCPDDNTVFASESGYDDVVRVLAGRISRDYKTPLTEEQLRRMPKKKNIGCCQCRICNEKFTFHLRYGFPECIWQIA